jgi:pimeloyl-ACP methyl ester carboxylesterase
MGRLQTVVTPYGPVEYREIGRGQPVVVFHGGQGNALNDTFDDVLDLDRYRIIVPSRPGYLGTPLGTNGSATATARLVHALLETLETGPAALIAISLGARPAIALAALFPASVRALVLSSPIVGAYAPRGSRTHALAHIFYNRWTEGPTWFATRTLFRVLPRFATQRFLGNITRQQISPLTLSHIAAVRQRIFSLRSYEGLIADLDQSIDDEQMRSVRCPTLIQHSRNDPSIGPEHPERAARLIAGSKLQLYDNDFGHFLWVGPGAEKTTGDIRAFLEEHMQPVPPAGIDDAASAGLSDPP